MARGIAFLAATLVTAILYFLPYLFPFFTPEKRPVANKA